MALRENTLNPYNYSGYQDAVKKWTKEIKIYDGLDVQLIASITFLTKDFRIAWSEEYAAAYKLAPAEKEIVIRDQMKAGGDFNDFIMTVYVPDDKWNDFSKKKSIWKLFLGKEGIERINPIEIRKLKIDNKINNHFFPDITVWKATYRLRFPGNKKINPVITSTHKKPQIILTVTGLKGSATAVWDISG